MSGTNGPAGLRSPAEESAGRGETATHGVAMAVMTVIFFMWGFLTSLNDVLIPHLKALFSLNYAQIMLVQFTFFGAYFVMSLPSGRLVGALGYKRSMLVGLVVAAGGALLFYPAAAMPSYGVFLAAFFTLATGITVLQVAANPYVSLIGPLRTAASRLNLAQALNSLGTTLAPKIGALLILSAPVLGAVEVAALSPPRRIAYRSAQAHLVQGPYLGLAAALLALAVFVWLFRMPSVRPGAARPERTARGVSFRAALARPHLLLGTVAIFVYVGAEVSIGSFMINYVSLPGIGNMSHSRAANFVALYWGGAMLGRFIGAFLLRRLDPRRVLGVFAMIAAVLVATTMLSSGALAVASIVVIGLFNSIMFPNIFTFGIEGMGELTEKASSLLIMAIVGGAVIPLAQGAVADAIGVQHAFFLPLLCYLYVAFYGFKGSRLGIPARAARIEVGLQ